LAKKNKKETAAQTAEDRKEEKEGKTTEASGAETAEEAGQQGPSLEEQLTASREEAKKNWDLYLRERANLENFRKRAQRDKEDLARFANEKILREILPVLDNLERALEHARESEGDNGGLLEGVEMTLGQLHKVLEKSGVTPVAALGETFDPAYHEAMGQLESEEHPPNTVARELQKGYLLNERLLRPALVMIAKGPSEPAAKD